MGTRAAAFTAKIHNLQHFNMRIQTGILPLPSGDDVANTLKYFSQTLLSVLKDVPSISLEMLRSVDRDFARTSLFPSLDYKGLFLAIVELVDAVPLVQHGSHALGQTILHTLACLVPFLEHEYMDTLPYLLASSMTSFPLSLHKDIIDMLCRRLLPFTYRLDTETEMQSYANMSTPAILMMIFQYTDCSAFHCQVLECYMSLKKDVVKDMLCVVAHGTAKARGHAVELLFQYLPSLNPALLDRKGIGWLLDSLCTLTCLVLFPTFSPSSVSPSILPTGSSHTGWKPMSCQRECCQSLVGNEAVKMCFNHSIAIGSGEQPPPLYLCEPCSEEIIKEYGPQHMIDILLPMDKVSVTCENADCKATDKSAVATCFSAECANLNSHRPIRYCALCVVQFHNAELGVDHLIHTTIPSPWSMDKETQSYMVEAVVSLLREAEPLNDKNVKEQNINQDDAEESTEVNVVEERQLLSRYGIWLLVGLCMPTEETPDDSLGRLLSILFQWFHYTACLPDDQAGNALERLKAEYIHGWLMEIVKSHFNVFVSCLLPHPAEYAKIGGHWETWPSYSNQIKEGFKRLLCLVPYDIITLEVWEHIMPYWMESFRHEQMEADYAELKILLSKVFDPDLSPLGFETKQMYRFLTLRFQNPSLTIREQALSWMQVLTLLEVPVPLELLYDMFNKGIEASKAGDKESGTTTCQIIPPASEMQRYFTSEASTKSQITAALEKEAASEESLKESTISSFILMLDILIKQLELQEVASHKGLLQNDAQNVMRLAKGMLRVNCFGSHECTASSDEGDQCSYCEICAIWFQLCLMIISYFCPVMEVTMADVNTVATPTHMVIETKPPAEELNQEVKMECDTVETMRVDIPLHEMTSVEVSELASVRKLSGPLMATIVQDVCPEQDTVALIPTETVVAVIANEVTITEDETARATCNVTEAQILDENNQPVPPSPADDTEFWCTSEGKYKFSLEELPPQMQLLFALLKSLAVHEDAEVLYHILSCIKVMCLHSEILNKAAQTNRGFVVWCEENLLIPNFWKLLQGEYSHIAQLSTALLLHSVTLPGGSDMFWKKLENEFHHDSWKLRYAAVEKATMIAHFMDATAVKASPLLQSALANAVCYLVRCLDDSQPVVSQRALLNLDSIKTSSLKVFLWCLEVQFDSNILDRPMILQTVSQMYNHLSHRRFVTWDFFMTRFDTLFIEAQVLLEKYGEVSYIRDLKNTNTNSEIFQKKLKKANEALAFRGSCRSLMASLGVKWNCQRAMSAPVSMLSRQEKIDKDKLYERQSSAPVLKRKSSKLIGSTISSLAPVQHFPNSFFTDSHLKETVQEENHFLNVLHRSMDLEEHDRETLHLLIFLFMQFLSSPDPSYHAEDKVSRSQHIVLRHLNFLLGFSQTQSEGKFLIPPHKIRSSVVFDAFIMSLPKVLDYNFSMGNVLISTCLSLLVCCPSPQRYPSEHYPPTYTLWLLEPYCRHSWLLSVLVIMYKYHYDSSPYSKYIQWLITIVLNTLKVQWHKCKLSHEPLLSPLPSRSRDFSTPSADLENVQEKEREASIDVGSIHDEIIKPYVGSGIKLKSSKFGSTEKNDDTILEQVQKSKDKTERQQWKPWKTSERSCSSEGEDAEPELEAIPESPKSEGSVYEQFPSEFNVDMVGQACVQLVSGGFDAEEQIIITDPGIQVSDDAHLVSNVSYEYQEKMDMEPSECKSLHYVEKASIETMEKDENLKEEQHSKIQHSFMRQSSMDSSNHAYKEHKNNLITAENQQMHLEHSASNTSPTAITDLDPLKSNNSLPVEVIMSHKDSDVPFTGRKKSLTHSLSLPKSEGSGRLYSKYPRPKLFQGRKKDIHKTSSQKQEVQDPDISMTLFRPPLERLLPIGIDKNRRLDAFESRQLMHHSLEPPLPVLEDKGVQAGGGGLPFDLPPPERLLPIGPPPGKKDWLTAPVFKGNVGSLDDQKASMNPQMIQHISESSQPLADSLPPPVTTKNTDVDQVRLTTETKEGEEKRTSKSPNRLLRQASIRESKTEDEIRQTLGLNLESVEGTQNDTFKASKTFCSLPSTTTDIEAEANEDPKPDIVSASFDLFSSCNNVFESKDGESQAKESNVGIVEKFSSTSFHNVSSIAEMLQNEKGFTSEFDLSLKHSEKDEEIKCKLPFRQRRQRKPGLCSLEPQRSFDYQNAGLRRMRKTDNTNMIGTPASKRSSTSGTRVEDIVVERCTECGTVLEEYSDEELGLCVVILATFVHREPAMASPFFPKMLKVVSRIASTTSYPWQSESNVHLPGGSVSVARQFLRCMLHQLAPNDIFIQIFQSHTLDQDFYKTMAAALADFTEVNQVTPLLSVFQNLNDKKHLHHETVFHILDNIATYLGCLPLESNIPPWALFLQQLETFLRKLIFALPQAPCQLNSILQIMLAALKTPVINNIKSLLDPFSKILSHAIQHSQLDYQQLVDLCRYCYRNVMKERDKLILTRTSVFELVQALKFKSSVPDANLLILVQFVLEDAGGCLGPNIIVEDFTSIGESNMYNTSSSECMRQYLNDVLEFVADVHTLNKVKNLLCGSSTHLNEETLGGQLKAGMAQYLAIEISKGNGRDNRAIGRYLPWLYHPPTALQQGPKEFIDCVSHIRLLSWLLLGALTHSSLLQHSASFVCQPIPLEANSHVAEHIQVILAGFAEQSKVSVLHMSSLFHAFILCQLWTMYCEHMVSLNPPGSEQSQNFGLTLTDFWSKVTPGILQLVCHSKVLAEMVSLHFLSLMEALMECNSTVLARLLPMWTPVLYSFQGQLPKNLQFRLRACINSPPTAHTREDATSVSTAFLRWLQRLQFKMGQIEVQSSTATQFYSL